MTADSNVLNDFAAAPPVAAPATVPISRQFFWSMRRELWENRSLYLAPLAVGALIVVGTCIAAFSLRRSWGDAVHIAASDHQRMTLLGFGLAASFIMATALLVAFFYCLDALYGERRDRSILFWKSLPVSDVTTVLSKIAIPVLVLPPIAFIVTVVTQGLMLLAGALLLPREANTGIPPLLSMWGMLLFHLLALHGLWYAPVYGWLLLVSAWAKRAPLLWAVLPPFVAVILEKIAFDTSYFLKLLHDRFSGGPDGAMFSAWAMANETLSFASVGRFLISPGMLIGLAVTAIFLVAAVQLRRYRSPI